MLCNFNSTKVRLKAVYEHAGGCEAEGFQFHKGSIKRMATCHTLLLRTYFNSTKVRLKASNVPQKHPAFINFNSTKVRLKGCRFVDCLLCCDNFNSTKVRLKVVSTQFPSVCYFHFNSTKVRLKVRSNAETQRKQAEFQFHKGSIKRRPTKAQHSARRYFNSTKVRLKGLEEEQL